jgi:hypothetical protein
VSLSDYENIAFAREGRSLTVTLSRPDRLNACLAQDPHRACSIVPRSGR